MKKQKGLIITLIVALFLTLFVVLAAVSFDVLLHLGVIDFGEDTETTEAPAVESVSESDSQSGSGVTTEQTGETESMGETESTDETESTGKTESTSDTEPKDESDTTDTTDTTDESESNDNTPDDSENKYGTLQNPVTTTYAYNACLSLGKNESSANPFYVKGKVTEIGKTGKYYENVYFTDGITEMLIYTINMGDGITGFEVGDTIVAYGYIKNYNGTTIEMATYNKTVYVYVVKVESAGGSQGGGDQSGGDQSGSTTKHTYTDFTSDEKSIWTQYIGETIPFIPNDEYYMAGYYDDPTSNDPPNYEYGVNFYTFDNTQAEFDAYRNLFSEYSLESTYIDEYGDTWYQYVKNDVVVDMSFYTVDDPDYGTYTCVDVYVYSSLSKDLEEDGGSSGGTGNVDPGYPDDSEINYGTLQNPVTTTYAYNACLSLGKNESSANPFYVKGKVTEIGKTGKYYENVYFTDNTTKMLIYTINMGDGITGFEVGDTIVAYGYIKNYNGTTIEMATYNESVYVYVVKVESAGGSQGGGDQSSDDNVGGGNTDDVNVITNDGKGLPQSANGIYDVDFTKGNYVQNVTDQGYYIDGCPTTGSPAVLVIPVEFSDVLASDTEYTIANIEKIFNGDQNDLSYYSVHDYYYISSYTKLDLDVTVVDEWFRPAEDSSYYETYTEDYYGEKVAMGDQLILDEALAYLEDKMDLSKFDSDNNGVIDAVIMVNTLDIGEDDFHWAYRYWNMYTDAEDYYYEYDGVSANDYIWISAEFMFESYDENGDVSYDTSNPLNPYTFIHEFGHVLGADDYYDTEYSENPLGGFDVMDAMAGDHNPYSKFNYGWLTTSKLVVTDTTVTVNLEAFAKNGDTLILANNWDESLGAYQEYFVIMYYTASELNSGEWGYFDRDGILVYHVNASLCAGDYDGEIYYDVYNSNTSASDEYGTEDNLIEFVLSGDGYYTYIQGDSLPEVKDDSGNTLGYTFTVDSVTADYATLTFTKK